MSDFLAGIFDDVIGDSVIGGHQQIFGHVTEDDIKAWEASAGALGVDNAPWVHDLLHYFPSAFLNSAGQCFAPATFHHIFWAWVYDLERGVRPDALINCWFRGASKSTYAEILPCIVGMRRSRSYILYISNTQEQADNHVQNIAAKLDAPAFVSEFPDVGERSLDKYGQSKGWRRNRLWTRSGLIVDALGLDTGRSRGLKLEDQRPDMIILDDIDDIRESAAVVEKNIRILSQSIIPAGSDDVAVCFIQNKVRDDGMMGRLVNNNADFLRNRIMNGPIPAIKNLEWREVPHPDDESRTLFKIESGEPMWAGKSIGVCEAEMNAGGISAFLQEMQHESATVKGGMFDHITYRRCRRDEMPEMSYLEIWCDPAVTDTDQSDSQGIQAVGLDANMELIYKIQSLEQRMSPRDAIITAITWANELNATAVGFETNQGGDLWREEYYTACHELHISPVQFKSEKATISVGNKIHRASQQIPDYETDKIIHVLGTSHILENAQRRFPKQKPFDLVDADYWGYHSVSRYRGNPGSMGFFEMSLNDLNEL